MPDRIYSFLLKLLKEVKSWSWILGFSLYVYHYLILFLARNSTTYIFVFLYEFLPLLSQLFQFRLSILDSGASSSQNELGLKTY